jgi:CheY-like chemotaxis protein
LREKAVLLVEDNAANRVALSRQLEAWGMVVHAVGSGAEALTLLQQDGAHFDVALVDGDMPHMDGMQFAWAVRDLAVGRTLPLIWLAAIGSSALLASASKLDGRELFAAVVTKPCKAAHLVDALLRALGASPPGVPPLDALPGTPAVVTSPFVAAGATSVTLPGTLADGASLAAVRPLRILLAEDNVVNQRVALLILRKVGYDADVAANGHEVLDALRRQPYDVVLMDVQMPEMDGLEATRQIRAMTTLAQQPHIIAMTANAMHGDRARCLAAGMDDYISKPMRAHDLQSILATLHGEME